MIRLNDLLKEAKTLNSRPPYVTWKFGKWDMLNKNELDQAMTRVLKTPVKMDRDLNPAENDDTRILDFKDSSGKTIYAEWETGLGRYGWKQYKHYANGDVDIVESYLDGTGLQKSFYRRNFDKDWIYLKTIDETGTRYHAVTKSGKSIKFSNNIMEPQNSEDSFVELRPDTKAYNAVKTNVFKD